MPSENGWEPARANAASQCEWVNVPGTNVTLQMLRGWPLQVMRAYAADYNAYIEPLRDRDSASFTPTNSVATSNHLNGTAMDLNWDSHPFRVDYAGFDAPKIARMRELLSFYRFEGLQIMFWAQDWNTPKDAMHHQMGYGTYGDQRVQRFINERIRPDGYSTYKRGTAPAVPAPAPTTSKADGYALAIIAEGRKRGITPRGIQIALSTAIVESGLKMYANRSVPESMNIPHDAVGSDHDSVGLFQQRCPMWGPAKVLMDPALSAGLFYDRLAKMNYNNAANPPGWYAAEVQRPAAQYRGRYQERMGEAVALYNRLAGAASPAPVPVPAPAREKDFAVALSDAEQRAMYNEIMERRQSRSPLRHVNSKWAGDMGDVAYNTDGSVHVLLNYVLAVILGDPDSINLLREVAANNEPDRLYDKRLAQAMLNLIDKNKTKTSAPPTGIMPGIEPAPSIPVTPAYVPPTVEPYVPPLAEVVSYEPPAPVPTSPIVPFQPAPESGLFAEITSLTSQLRAVSETVTKIVQGSDDKESK